MLTPAKVLKLWNRLNDRFGLDDEEDGKGQGKEKKPSPKVKQFEKEGGRVTKGLTRLRNVARGDLKDPGTIARFIKARDVSVKSMKKYCKLLKGDSLKEAVEDLGKLRKAAKQLTVVVEKMEAKPYPPETEEGEVDLNALEGVDTAALDQAMEDPKFGEYSDAELADLDKEDEDEATTPEPSPSADGSAAFTARLKALLPAIQKSQAEGTPIAQEIKLRTSEANALARKKDFTQAQALLDQIEALLSNAAPSTTSASANLAAEFKAKLQAVSPDYQKALQAGAANRAQLELLMKQAFNAARSEDYEEGLAQLDKLAAELARSAATSPSPQADGATAVALAGWQAARQKAIGQLRQLAAAIAGTGDPDGRQPLILVNAIIKNLTASPSTPQSVAELERYLQTDNVITDAEIPNSWGVTVELQKPLLQALAPLKKALGS
jgi:hypothetical protein